MSDILDDLREMYASPVCKVRHGNLSGAIQEIIRLREAVAVRDEQLGVATARAKRYRDTLMRLAARAHDYSGPCIQTQVADALEITTAELHAQLNEDKP